MKERLLVLVVFFVGLCGLSTEIPLCPPNAVDCIEGTYEQPTFSSRYRALEYDETVMRLLMEVLLKQHNAFCEDGSDAFAFQESASKDSSSIIGASESWDIHNPLDRNEFNVFDSLPKFQNQKHTDSMQTFEELSSTDEPEHLLRYDSNNNNRYESIPLSSVDVEHSNIIMKPFIEWDIQDLERLVGDITTTDVPVTKNILSSKYKDPMRRKSTTTHINGPHALLHNARPFDGFSDIVPSSSVSLSTDGIYREHYREPPTTKQSNSMKKKKKEKKKTKINVSKSVDRHHQVQKVRGEAQLEILNRPINAGNTKPPATTGLPSLQGCDKGNATSCKPNNKKSINSNTKVKMEIEQKPAKVQMTRMTPKTTAIATSTDGGVFGKPNSAVAAISSAPTVADGNLILALASIVDSDENDAEDSTEDNDDDDDDEEESRNSALSKDSDSPKSAITSEEAIDYNDDEDDDDDDVISSVVKEVNALIRRQTA